jgi:multiple sugar transport system permease protein
MLRASFRTNLIAYLFMAPFLIGFLAFLVGPLVYALVLSLFRESMIGGTRFVGFANYLQVVQDTKFWQGIWNMLVFGFILVPFLLVLSLIIALLLDSHYPRAKGFFRIAIFLPYAIPGVIAAVIWGYLYGPVFGPITQIAQLMKLPAPPLLSDTLILFTLANIVVWELVGYKMIIVFSALQNVSPELEEAAVLDGASDWQYAWHIKVPLVGAAMMLNAIFAVIGTLQLFNEPSIIKTMAPAVISNHFTPNMYARSLSFIGQQINYAAALSFLLGLVVALLSFVVVIAARWRRAA